jgi:predicted aldo/keto reductase-like oxidoreductase
MVNVKLGKSEIIVNKNGFGALPIQRVPMEQGVEIIRKAYDGGINYFDTARAYTDSEKKISKALGDVRENVIIASKTRATNVEDFWKDLKTSLKELNTDYIDLYQFHDPPFVPKLNDGTELYESMLKAKREGLINHVGITSHNLIKAKEAVNSGFYETLQFPFSYLSEEKDLKLVKLCDEKNVGFIAMKAFSGGLIKNGKAAFGFMGQFNNVLPIWGIQKQKELDEALENLKTPVKLNKELIRDIEKDKKELSGEFCRGCGYCSPCTVDIKIFMCARMSLFLRRFPPELYLTEEFQNIMEEIPNCTHCDECKKRCPYGLDIPTILEENYEDYKNILSGKTNVSYKSN